VNTVMKFVFVKGGERLLASKEGLCFMELVTITVS
jgi:hypothetical protein